MILAATAPQVKLSPFYPVAFQGIVSKEVGKFKYPVRSPNPFYTLLLELWFMKTYCNWQGDETVRTPNSI